VSCFFIICTLIQQYFDNDDDRNFQLSQNNKSGTESSVVDVFMPPSLAFRLYMHRCCGRRICYSGEAAKSFSNAAAGSRTAARPNRPQLEHKQTSYRPGVL
jgi:hypothetical protein